jgi:hypothetical protein
MRPILVDDLIKPFPVDGILGGITRDLAHVAPTHQSFHQIFDSIHALDGDIQLVPSHNLQLHEIKAQPRLVGAPCFEIGHGGEKLFAAIGLDFLPRASPRRNSSSQENPLARSNV